MLTLLFLDDERNPPDVFWNGNLDLYKTQQWNIVRTYDEFVAYVIINGIPDLLSFDNDLGEEKEGVDCAKWLIDYCIDNKIMKIKFLVHSKNPIAKQTIIDKLDWYLKHADKY